MLFNWEKIQRTVFNCKEEYLYFLVLFIINIKISDWNDTPWQGILKVETQSQNNYKLPLPGSATKQKAAILKKNIEKSQERVAQRTEPVTLRQSLTQATPCQLAIGGKKKN